MMKKIFLLCILAGIYGAHAQVSGGNVGINTISPTETLDVNGIAHGDLLYLRSPGEPLELPINFMASQAVKLDIYDPTLENSSLVNLLNLNFNNVSNVGVVSYNTKIDASEFTAAVRSFSLAKFAGGVPTTLEVYLTHNLNTSNTQTNFYQGSPDFVCYVAPTDPGNANSQKTWWVRARYLDSKFTENDGTIRADRYTIKLQLLVYKKLITKAISQTQSTNLNGTAGTSNTYSVPKPSGF